jgi:hypothetical protein
VVPFPNFDFETHKDLFVNEIGIRNVVHYGVDCINIIL